MFSLLLYLLWNRIWATRAELANHFPLFCAFWADAFQYDVNIYSTLILTFSRCLVSPFFYSLLTILYHLLWFHSILFKSASILISVSDIKPFNSIEEPSKHRKKDLRGNKLQSWNLSLKCRHHHSTINQMVFFSLSLSLSPPFTLGFSILTIAWFDTKQ